MKEKDPVQQKRTNANSEQEKPDIVDKLIECKMEENEYHPQWHVENRLNALIDILIEREKK